ncbi:MAG: hypothetical protein ABSH16_10285 [Sedimentisphaerales bacterium]
MGKIFRFVIGLTVVLGVLGAGCEQKQQAGSPIQSGQAAPTPAKSEQGQVKTGEVAKPKPAAIKMELKPAVGQEDTYKTATEMKRIIKWEGAIPSKDIPEESFSDDKMEMVFTRRIESKDANGDAIARVTIDRLKYTSVMKNQTVVDFDSSAPADANNPLAGLTGQSYTITIEPNNYVSSVTNLPRANVLMKGMTTADRIGQNILSADAIRGIQSTLLLPPAGREDLLPGDKWSQIKTFGFGMMGIKSYEKIYTLKDVQDFNGRKIAVIGMSAIPSSEVEPKYSEQQGKAGSSSMFDTNEVFTGKGELDLTAGCIKNYSENLKTSWIAAIPPSVSKASDANEPTVLKMTAVYSYTLEKIK